MRSDEVECKPIRKCLRCDNPLPDNNPTRLYCSLRCRPSMKKNDACSSDTSKSSRGAMGELVVSADLLQLGFEVFRSVSPSSSCDLIAMKNNQLFRVEVKSSWTTYTKADGKICNNWTIGVKQPNSSYDILAIVRNGEVTYDPPLNNEENV